jgi:DUF971 family protein
VTSGKGGRLPLLGPDPNAARDVRLVGRYAIGVDWQDSHSSIYPFEFLRSACSCPECTRARAEKPAASGSPATLDEAQTWPIEIKKADTGLRIRWQDDHVTVFEGRDLRQICRCAACTTPPS